MKILLLIKAAKKTKILKKRIKIFKKNAKIVKKIIIIV
jgi:hypothetical protein